MGSADLSTGLRFVLRMGLRDATWMLYGHCTYVGPVRHKMGRFFRPTGLGRTKREDHTWDWMIVSVRRAIEEKAWPQESAQFLRSLSPTSPERQPVDGRISSREPKERGRGSERRAGGESRRRPPVDCDGLSRCRRGVCGWWLFFARRRLWQYGFELQHPRKRRNAPPLASSLSSLPFP